MAFIIPAFYLALTVFVLIDVIRSDESSMRNLNKMFWILIVLFFPLVGSILWFAVGRGYDSNVEPVSFGDPRRVEARLQAPRSIEDELAAIDSEIEYHEKQARIRKLEADLQARKERDAQS